MTKLNKLSISLNVIVLLILVVYFAYVQGQKNMETYHYEVMKNQWQGEIKRFQYAYEHVDSCASDDCVEVWSELLGNDNLKAK